MSHLEQMEKQLEDKINLIQDEVKELKETLHTVIERMNDFQRWMDMTMDKSIRSYEENDVNEIIEFGSKRPRSYEENETIRFGSLF